MLFLLLELSFFGLTDGLCRCFKSFVPPSQANLILFGRSGEFCAIFLVS